MAGGKLKEKGYTNWARYDDPSGPAPLGGTSNATNESGFTSLPAGIRFNNIDNFAFLKYEADYWTSTKYDNSTAWNFSMEYNGDEVGYYKYNWYEEGQSVRCIKD